MKKKYIATIKIVRAAIIFTGENILSLKKTFLCLFFCFFNTFALLIFKDRGADTLTSRQKLEIMSLAVEQKKGIDADRIKFGIVCDIKNNEKNKFVDLIKSYITDSLGYKKSVILEKKFSWTQSLETPFKDVRLPTVEIIPVTNFIHSELIIVIDSSNAKISNDTINVDNGGFMLIRYNNNHRITLHPNTSVILSHSSISLIKGDLSISQSAPLFKNQYIIPLTVDMERVNFNVGGDAFISKGKEFSVLHLYKGSAVSKTSFSSNKINAPKAVSVSNCEQKSFEVDLPPNPSISKNGDYGVLPGGIMDFKNLDGYRQQRIIIGNDKYKKLVDTISDNSMINWNLGFGEFSYFVQNVDSLGVVSFWAKKLISVEKIYGLKSIDHFGDSLYLVTDDRPFAYHGFADTSVKIFVNYEEISINSNGEFGKKVMLNDSLNYSEIIVQYKDLSGDTIFPVIFYTGYDERTKMNDTILNKPAFTTEYIYKWQISAPTALSVKINGQEIEGGEDGKFEKIFKIKAYRVYPVIVDILYENGNQKTFSRTLTRERYVSSRELTFKEVLLAFTSFATAIIIGLPSFLGGSGQ